MLWRRALRPDERPRYATIVARRAPRRVHAGIVSGIAVLLVIVTVSVSGVVRAGPATLRLTTHASAKRDWWSAAAAPMRWPSAGVLAAAAAWRPARPGVEWCTMALEGVGEAHAITLVLVRLDPRQVQLGVRWGLDAVSARPAWAIDAAPDDAVVAVNAGMFADALPWGWVVSEGAELLPPGFGPLSSALVVGRDGAVELVDAESIAARRARGGIAEAFQSYPSLLTGDGVVPEALRAGDAIDRAHRDARLAIGIDRGGRVLLVLTRLATDLPLLDRIPVGLTVPEMAAVMGSLGAARAALLDGGVSAQLRLVDADGTHRDWRGVRRVPLALVARAR